MAAGSAGSVRAAALVLVADRDPVVRELAEHFLLEAGYQVELVTDGESALCRALDLRPDVIVTEVLLPRLDGFALCRRLKADASTREVPVLVLSVLAAAERAREAGAAGFLLKPLAERRLVEMVGDLLQARTVLPPEASA